VIVFLDTNILLDVLANRQPHVRAAKTPWEWSERDEIDGIISAISFNNIFYIVRKSQDEKTARECLRSLRAIFRAVEVNEKILHQAIDSVIADFEDAIQYFSAIRAGADYFVTRSPHDFPANSPVPVLTAEMLVVLRSQKIDH